MRFSHHVAKESHCVWNSHAATTLGKPCKEYNTSAFTTFWSLLMVAGEVPPNGRRRKVSPGTTGEKTRATARHCPHGLRSRHLNRHSLALPSWASQEKSKPPSTFACPRLFARCLVSLGVLRFVRPSARRTTPATVSLSLVVKMGTTDVSLYTAGKGKLARFAFGGVGNYALTYILFWTLAYTLVYIY